MHTNYQSIKRSIILHRKDLFKENVNIESHEELSEILHSIFKPKANNNQVLFGPSYL